MYCPKAACVRSMHDARHATRRISTAGLPKRSRLLMVLMVSDGFYSRLSTTLDDLEDEHAPRSLITGGCSRAWRPEVSLVDPSLVLYSLYSHVEISTNSYLRQRSNEAIRSTTSRPDV